MKHSIGALSAHRLQEPGYAENWSSTGAVRCGHLPAPFVSRVKQSSACDTVYPSAGPSWPGTNNAPTQIYLQTTSRSFVMLEHGFAEGRQIPGGWESPSCSPTLPSPTFLARTRLHRSLVKPTIRYQRRTQDHIARATSLQASNPFPISRAAKLQLLCI
ncbi:hypothetical protein EJ03DRAFT_176378 [Teratosphaeria nubilosa]|uniref:Uncharacterized protein n=1 Tax=Teratosphaeria nubilosa TaxID=161662 RepID=A0A6G1L102_9PEZI|nr:hypothetical protein EJ03DRAFT_176378 [Teratosphaeria nubilosa]